MLPEMHDMGWPYFEPDVGKWYARDYFRRSSRLWRRVTRLVVAMIAAVATLPLIACVVGSFQLFQAGPLSDVRASGFTVSHRQFNNDCFACHTEHFETWKRLLPWCSNSCSVSDAACVACHPATLPTGANVATQPAGMMGRTAPPHNRCADTQTPACASCHREHRGWPTLTRVPDDSCTDCHGDLKRAGCRNSPFANITSFESNHEEFGILRRGEQDPARFRFSHRTHLVEGGVVGPGNTREVLECGTCHQPQADGRYMQPISYQSHCARCHPLRVPIASDALSDKTRDALRRLSDMPAPHVEPAKVRAALEQRYREFAREHPDVENPSPPGADPWAERQLARAERLLFFEPAGCERCHEPKPEPVASSNEIRAFEKSAIKPQWFAHAAFSHAPPKHQELDCTKCHTKARGSDTAQHILLPDIAVCRGCHVPRAGARSDCAECHRYHKPELVDRLTAPREYFMER